MAAFASRFLSRSKQLYAGEIISQKVHAVPVRYFAKEAATAGVGLKGDEMLKNIFLDVKTKFQKALGVLREEKITIDPEDPAAVNQYAKVMKTVREKADLFSESQRIQYTIQTRTQNIPDARSYLLTLKEIRIKRGLTDDLGAEAMMMDALEKVEKELKRPLMRSDKKGMALLLAEFDKINKKLGIRKEDLPKYEEELEHKIAKAQLQELKKDVTEAMETQKKRIWLWLTTSEQLLNRYIHLASSSLQAPRQPLPFLSQTFQKTVICTGRSSRTRKWSTRSHWTLGISYETGIGLATT